MTPSQGSSISVANAPKTLTVWAAGLAGADAAGSDAAGADAAGVEALGAAPPHAAARSAMSATNDVGRNALDAPNGCERRR
jgi:hypothetical protein